MPTFTDGYGGDVQTYIDTFMNYDDADTNFGSETRLQLYLSAGDSKHIALLKFNLASIPDGSKITSATLYLYELGWGSGAYTATVHRILSANSAWTESDATWNYAVATSTRWAGDTGGDGGADAGCSVSGTDYNATSMGTLSGDGDNSEGTEYTVSLSTSQVEAMLTADYGLVLIPTSQSGVEYLFSSDHATSGYRPKLVVVYTKPIAGMMAHYRRRRIA